MSLTFNSNNTSYYLANNLRAQVLEVVGSDNEQLYTFPVAEKPFSVGGEIMLFNNNGSSTFIPYSDISPNLPSSYGTFSADPNSDIPSNSTYKFLFNQTQDSPVSNITINQDNDIVIQEAGNYLFLIDTEGQTNTNAINSNCLIQVLNNGTVINQALVGENTFTNSINTILFQSVVSCDVDDIISITISTQDIGTSVNIRNLTLTINFIPPLIDTNTNSSYGTFQIANETQIPANTQYTFPLIQTTNSPIQSITLNAGDIQFGQAGNYLLILDTEGYVSNVLSTQATFSITKNGQPINPALIATNTYSTSINSTVFQSLITVSANDIIRVVIASQNTFGAVINIRNLTISLISLVIGGGGGGGNPNALITSDSIQTPTQGAIIIADGIDPFLCHPTSLLTIDNEGLRINDPGNSEYTTLSTSMGQTYLVNSGNGGITLNGTDGEITLTTNNNNINLNGTNIILKANSLTTRNIDDSINYELRPNQQPYQNNVIMEWQANGQVGWIPTPSGGGSAGALINTDYITDAPIGSVFIFNGDNGTDGNPSDAIQVQPSGNVKVGNIGNSVLINSGDNGSAGLQIGDPYHKILLDGTDFIMSNSAGNTNISSRDNISLDSGISNIMMRSENGVDIKQAITNKFTKLQQINDDLNITNSNAGGNVIVNSSDKLKLYNTGILLNDTARIENNDGYLYTRKTGGNLVYACPDGGIVYQTPNAFTIQETNSYKYTNFIQRSDGIFQIKNEVFEGNLELNATTGGILVNTANGLIFNGISASINNDANNLRINNAGGDVEVFSKFNNVVVNAELGQFIVNNQSRFQGDVNIVEDIPKLGFQSNLLPSNNALISYDNKDFVIKNNEASNTTLTYMNLQENDIVLSTATQNGIIDLQVGSGSVSINGNARFVPQPLNAIEFKNDNGDMTISSAYNVKLDAPSGLVRVGGTGGAVYALPNGNPNDNDIMLFNSSGLSSFSSIPYPNQTQSFYVSKTGTDAVGSGSAVLPFLTVSYALDQANLLSASTKTTIYVFNGIYDESFTITKNNLTLTGGSAIPQQTQINGTITYNIDGAGSQIYSSLFGLTINGVNYNGSAYNDNGSFVIGAVVIGNVAGVVPLNITYSGTGNRDYTLNNTVLYAVDTVSIYINKGTINSTACLFTETTTSNVNPIVDVVGGGILNLFGTVVLSLNATTSAPPVIRFTTNINSTCQFNSSTIGYAFPTINTGTLTKVCVSCQNTGILTLTVFNNKFDGAGTRITNGGGAYVVISKEGAGALNINYSQNIGTASAQGVHNYPTAATRTQLQTCV
jgi:hypothetical protein